MKNNYNTKVRLLVFTFLCSVLSWGQVNITPIRTDVAGFPTWTDTAIANTTYLQLTTNTSTTISPTMDFSGYSSITLDFKARMFGGPSAAEKVITVSISTNGSTWTTLGTNSPTSTTLTAVTQYNLDTYIGQTTVRLRFQTLAAAGGRGSGIDDIDIKGTLSGPTLSATALTAFGSQCVGATYGPNSFTITGSSLNGSNVTVGGLTGYTYCTTALGTYASPLVLSPVGATLSQQIFVKFSPITAISYNGNIPISGGGASGINVAASGSGLAAVTPAVTIVASPSGTICAGTSVTFTATPSNLGGGTAAYQWKVNGTNVGTGTTYASTALVNSDVITCDLTVTGGCVTSATATSNSIAMTVNPTPATPIAPTAAANPSCGATTLNLMVAPAGETYYWQGTTSGGVLTTSDASSVAYNVSSTGTYYVRSRNNTTGCWSAQSSVLVTVNTLPTVPTTADPAAICQGTAVTITGIGSTGATSYTFWDAATGGTQYVTGGGYTVSATALTTPTSLAVGTYTYYVQGQTATCISTTRKTVTVTINATPSTPSGTISISANPSCGAATLTYSAPSANIYWQTSTGGTSTAFPTTTAFTSLATAGTYTRYVRELNGTCWSPEISITFTINTLPTVPTNADPAAICQGTAVTITGTGSTGATSYTFWDAATGGTQYITGGGYTVSATALTTPTSLVAGTYTYYVQGQTATCSSTTRKAVTVTVNTAPSTPSGTISISNNPSCGAATLSYSAPNANIYWQTTAGGTSTGSPTTSNYTSSATANTYTIYVREKNGSCWSPAISVTFTVVEPVTITAQPPNRVITDGNNTTFTVSATGTGLTFQWQVDTGSGFNDISLVAPYSAATTGGATKTNTLTITAAPITMNGYVYRCVISGTTPCGSVTSSSGSLTVTLTPPNNPTVIVPCYGNNTLGLSWTASTFGATPAPDGYMVFALAGGTTPAATSAVAGNSTLYTANSDFSLATVVTASLGKCVYKGTGTSVTITGLANLSSYSFKVVAYRGTTGTVWSSGINTNGSWNSPATNITIDIPEVSSFAASIANNQSVLTWSNPIPSACYDQYLIVANQGTVVFTPSGDGSAYTANSAYSTSNQVVYKGTGTGVTVTGLTNGTNYCYKVFVRKGTEWSDGVSVCQIPNIVYCALTATDSSYEHITNVTVGTDINNNTASSGYANYTAQVANATIGLGTPISVTVTPSYATDNVYVYVDWNKDGDWIDSGENITMSYTAAATSFTATSTITPPVTALIGNTRMRVIVVDGTVSDACNGGANFTYGEVEDYTINVLAGCISTHSVTSFTPTSGPVGTEVTINGNGLTGATVSFSGINATIVSNSGTQIVVIIPIGATTGMLSVKDSQPCSIDNSFTILKNDKTTCEGFMSDLIIYEVYDEERSSGGAITIFNGTLTTKNLANYRIYRAGTYGGAYSDFANLTGSIAPGALGIIKVTGSDCGPAATNGSISGGFNDFDGLQLRLSDGTTVVDDVQVPGYIGYYMKRSPGNYLPRTTFVGSDWTTVDVGEVPVGTNECLPMGTPPSVTGDSPVVTTHPTYSPSCGSTSVTLNTAGTQGFAGGNPLAYQWYFAAPGSATWTEVTDGGIYSGATTASLNISVVTGVINYQYYCQIRENLATCYSATNAVKITDTSASTWNGITWIGGTPTITKAAIIDGTYVTATNGNFSCCSLTVNSGVGRSLTISSGGYVEVQNNITSNGILDVLSDGSLVQISDAGVNTGNVFVKRTANVRLQDYSYWSVPVSSATGTPVFPIASVSPSTPLGVIWKWGAASPNANGGEGMWLNTTENMVKGTGYAVRGPSGTSNATTTPMNANFSGVPNNGVIPVTIARGSDLNAGTSGPNGIMRTIKDDNFNLIGNPYPSAIDADLFIARYAVVSSPDYADIEGSVRIWSHNTLPLASNSNPFYANYQMNYSANDYITYNSLGSQIGPATYLGKIPSGQGFFVLMKDGVAGTNTINFRNALRSKTFDNSQFFRTTTSNTNVQNNTVQKHRIWLDIISPTNSVTRTLIGYATGATNGLDNTFDAITDSKMAYNLYSIVNNEVLTIQGRALPFDTEDKVQMGVKIASPGLYKIAIATADGIFSNSNNSGQKIYLEDKDLNIIHDLTIAPYEFNGVQGKFESRFVIRYNNGTVLSNETFDANNNVVVVSNQELSVLSTKEKIANILVYDVLGRKLFEGKDIKTNNFTLPISKHNVPLFIEIGLESGIKINRKVVY